MLQPADVLFLDEPTNDLDISTLEVLEESLLEFTGALVLVTHDRYLLDRVSTSVLALDGEGGVSLFADYSQWEQARSARVKPKPVAKEAQEPAAATQAKKRLSYLDSREWDSMEEKILLAEETLEQKKAAVAEAAADAGRLPQCYKEMLDAQAEVDRLYERWAELGAKLG